MPLLYLKVLAVGPGQVGKTTFFKRLTGQMQWDIQTAQQETMPQGSTGQAEMQVVHIEYSNRTVAISLNRSTWDILEEIDLVKHISSLVSLLKMSEPSTADIKLGSHSGLEKSEANPIVEYTSSQSEQVLPEVCSVNDSEDEQEIQDNVKPTTHKRIKADENLQQLIQKEKVHVFLPSHEPTKIDKVISEFKKLRHSSMLTETTINLDAVINLADIGGQPAFLEMLPSLTVGPAMYLVFMKIIEGLKTQYPVRFRRQGNKTSTEHKEYMYTCEEVIFTALSSIACFGNSDEEVEQYVTDKTVSKRTNSLALLMGTFADALLKESKKDGNLKNEEVYKMEQQLKQQLTDTEFYTNDLIAFSDSTKGEVLFRIDNKNGGETEVRKYRKLLETFMERKFKKFNIPTPWLMFSICIKILALHEEKHDILFDDCVKIGKKLHMSKQMVTSRLAISPQVHWSSHVFSRK